MLPTKNKSYLGIAASLGITTTNTVIIKIYHMRQLFGLRSLNKIGEVK